MEITSTSERPFQRVAIDIVGPLPTTEDGNTHLLTLQDDLTKFSGAYAIPNTNTTTIAKTLVLKFLSIFGFPEKILSDQGPQFTSELFNEVCKILKIKHITSTAFHPQSNGALERSHKTLKEYLRCFTVKEDYNWDEMIHYALFVYNTTPHTATKFTPYELLFGRQANIPTSIRTEPQPIYSYDDYVIELRSRFRISHWKARENLLKAKQNSKFYYDKNIKPLSPLVGDKVYLKNESRKNKLAPLWTGPYTITNVHKDNRVTINKENKLYLTHTNRLKRA